MTDQERLTRFVDLQNLIVSKGYIWYKRMLTEQIKEEQEAFLRVDTDQDRFEKQIRLKVLSELADWVEEEVMRCRSLKINA